MECRQTNYDIKRTLVGNEIIDHSDHSFFLFPIKTSARGGDIDEFQLNLTCTNIKYQYRSLHFNMYHNVSQWRQENAYKKTMKYI